MVRFAPAMALAALIIMTIHHKGPMVRAARLDETDAQQVVSSSVHWQPPSFCRGKDCPEFNVLETRDDVELRHYKRAHWISTNVSNAKFSDAYDEGYKRLQKYVSGENVDAKQLPQTNPSFVILYVADLKARTLQTTYTIEYFVPFELQDKPPQPNSTELAVTPVDELDVWVLAFGGFATEDVVVKRGFEFIDNLTGDGVDIHTEFMGLALYEQPARLVKRHNELWLWPKGKPSAAAARRRKAARRGSSDVETSGDVDEEGTAMRFKRTFKAMVKRLLNGS